ncbi:MAG: arsenate reductase [Sphingobacteriales bacterium]|nr:arsenate reductase [Sphingobacteriales bacterium]
MKVYGIKNCDTVKKALSYLDDNGITYEFHDYKKLGVEDSKIKEWANKVPFEKLINTKGPTYRKLTDAEKAKLSKMATAIPVMQEHTSVIKRPILEFSGKIILGFDVSEYDKADFM